MGIFPPKPPPLVLADLQVDENGEYILETESEKLRRKYSRWIIYFSMFIQSIGFSIVLTGVWPYLQKIHDDPPFKLLGLVIAANPIGQFLFSPLVGWACNRLNAVRIPTVFCLIAFIGANCWYALLPLHTYGGMWFMIAARFFVGVSSAGIASCKTFITQGTKISERTRTIAELSLFQALGFILGPAIQAILVLLGDENIVRGTLTLNMYTAAGWTAAIFGILNLIMYHPKIFTESRIAEKEALIKVQTEGKKPDWSHLPVDYMGVVPILIGFFVILLNFVLLETLAVPVAQDQFSWSDKLAVRNVGIVTSVTSVISLFCFFSVSPLSKRYDERLLLFILGFVLMILGRIFFFPLLNTGPADVKHWECQGVFPNGTHDSFFGPDPLVTKKECIGYGAGFGYERIEHVTVVQGCPLTQEWCLELNKLNIYIVGIGYLICTIGYPYCLALSQTIFSKMIGPRPQGLWMGVLTAVSSVARILGPIFNSYVYVDYGTIAVFGTAIGASLFSLILLICVYKHIVPFKPPIEKPIEYFNDDSDNKYE